MESIKTGYKKIEKERKAEPGNQRAICKKTACDKDNCSFYVAGKLNQCFFSLVYTRAMLLKKS